MANERSQGGDKIPKLLSGLSLKYPEQIQKSCMCSAVWVWCKMLTLK